MSADTGRAEVTPSTVVPVGNPAAGAQFSYAPGTRVRIQCITATLTTSAVVANRTPRLTIADGAGHNVSLTPLAQPQLASTVATYSWYVGAPQSSVAAAVMTSPIPDLETNSAWTVSSVTGGMDVGDQWSAIVITIIQ